MTDVNHGTEAAVRAAVDEAVSNGTGLTLREQRDFAHQTLVATARGALRAVSEAKATPVAALGIIRDAMEAVDAADVAYALSLPSTCDAPDDAVTCPRCQAYPRTLA
jgi:hypothetical protein